MKDNEGHGSIKHTTYNGVYFGMPKWCILPQLWLAGKTLFLNGIGSADDLANAIHVLGCYFFYGDSSINLNATQNNDKRAIQIQDVIKCSLPYRSLSDTEKREIESAIEVAVNYRRKLTVAESAAIRKKARQKATAKRVEKAYLSFRDRTGEVPGLRKLSRLASCSTETAKGVIAKFAKTPMAPK